MILLFDAGNSRLKWRTLQHGKLVAGGQQGYQRHPPPLLLDEMWGSLQTPTAVWGFCVAAPSMAEHISRWSHAHWAIEPRFVTAAPRMGGVTNGYLAAEKLGADRWMALIGAAQLYPGACCVADCGSAVTVDCLSMNHDHLGGVIIPGLAMMPRCVAENTAQVEVGDSTGSELGRDTASCLAAGARYAISGALEQIVTRMESRDGVAMHRVITGGDAEQILPWLGNGWHHEPDLLFMGLASAIKEAEGNK